MIIVAYLAAVLIAVAVRLIANGSIVGFVVGTFVLLVAVLLIVGIAIDGSDR